jgi:hypothetical protein
MKSRRSHSGYQQGGVTTRKRGAYQGKPHLSAQEQEEPDPEERRRLPFCWPRDVAEPFRTSTT